MISAETSPIRWHVSGSGPYTNRCFVACAIIGASENSSGGLVISQVGNTEPHMPTKQQARHEATLLAIARLEATLAEMRQSLKETPHEGDDHQT